MLGKRLRILTRPMAAIVITIAIACCAYCSVPPRDLPQVLKAEGPADAEAVVHRFSHEDRPGQSRVKPALLRYQLDPEDASPGDRVVLSITMELDENWTVYSTTQGDGGEPTTIELDELYGLEADGTGFQADPVAEVETPFPDLQLEVHRNRVTWTRELKVVPSTPRGGYGVVGTISYQPCKTSCLAPKPVHFHLGDLSGIRSDVPAVAVAEPTRSKPIPVNTASFFIAGRFDSIFDLIASAVTAGCIAALTPCVLTTGGMTIGCFARQSEVADSQALLPLLSFYWSIVAICSALSFASRLIFGVSRINGWINNPWLNIAILSTYVLLIGLMLGTIRWPNTTLTGSCVEGILMGSSFSIATFPVAFSYSSTLLIAVHGNLAWSVLGTAAFASGIAAPFFFLALLPSVLKSLTGSKVFLRTLRMVVSILLLGWFANSTLTSIAGFTYNQPAVTLPTNVWEPSTTEFGTNYLIDVDHAIAVATEQQRPLLLEFCYINDVQHSLMNRSVAEPHNRSRMSKFVCAKLFVDTVPLVDRKESKRLLERNHEFDIQPLGKAGSWYQSHVVMSPDGKVVLASFGGIEQKKGEFAAFLDEGWRNWEDFQAGHFLK